MLPPVPSNLVNLVKLQEYLESFRDTLITEGGGGIGAQGAQGATGAQGAQGMLNPDIYVATRVVDSAGNGTDTTIAAAIAALPSGGGVIYIKNGTYSISSTITLTNKPITFIGAGDATVIDLGANAISAFTIPFAQVYSFARLKILGSGITGQAAFDVNTGGSTAYLMMSDVTVENVEITFFMDPADFSYVYTTNCFFDVANLATSFHWDGPGQWIAANTVSLTTGGLRGGFNNGTNLNLAWDNSEITPVNGGGVAYVQIDRCTISGSLTVSGQGSIIANSVFDAPSTTRYIDITADSVTVAGCSFGTASAEHIRISTSNCIITDNSPCEVTEIGGANNNTYANNIGFTTSTIIGTGSRVDGARRHEVTGSTTVDALTAVFTHTNHKGLAGAGSIKNTGSNSLTVRRTATDGYGTTDFVEDVVIAGATLTWPIDTAVGAALPEFVSFTVSVKSTSAGNATTYNLRHTSHGGEL